MSSSVNSTENDRLRLWLGRIHVEENAAENATESNTPYTKHAHSPLDSQAGPSSLKNTPTASTSSRGSHSSSDWNSSQNYCDGDAESEFDIDDEGSFQSMSPKQDAPSHAHIMRPATHRNDDGIAAAHQTKGMTTTPNARRHHRRSHSSQEVTGNCETTDEEHQNIKPCFICQTTDMTFSMKDPDGRPICVVCGNLYYRHRA